MTNVLRVSHQHINATNFPYLNQVINESQRFSPPVQQTGEYKILKDCQINGINFKRDTTLNFNIHGAHHNPGEWQEPDKFLPMRFDPAHPLSKTPSGGERTPMSFIPFGFGERKCLGYLFAKVVIPSLAIKIIHQFDIRLTDQSFAEEHKYPMALIG